MDGEEESVILIDLDKYKIKVDSPEWGVNFSLACKSNSQRFYLALIGFVATEMARSEDVHAPIDVNDHISNLRFLDKTIAKRSASKTTEAMVTKISKSWNNEERLCYLPKVMFSFENREKYRDSYEGNIYKCHEQEIEFWNNFIIRSVDGQPRLLTVGNPVKSGSFADNIVACFQGKTDRLPDIWDAFMTSLQFDIDSYRDAKPENNNTAKPFLVLPRNTPNLYVKGQDNYIDDIEKIFLNLNADKSQRIAIVGQAGVGKSTLALEYAISRIDHYPGGVVFLNMGDGWRNALEDLFKKAKKSPYQVPSYDGLNDLQAKEAIIAFLDNLPFKLVILDNLENDEEISDVLFNDAHILITTRRRDIIDTRIELETPSSSESESILLAYAGKSKAKISPEEAEGLQQLLREVDCLPLALEILGRIWSTINLDYVVKRVREKAAYFEARTLAKGEVSVAACLALAAERFSPLAWSVLLLASYLEPNSLSPRIFTECLGADTENIYQAISELRAVSILKDTPTEDFGIHRLTQAAARGLDANQAIGQQAASWLNKVITVNEISGDELISINIFGHLYYLGSLSNDNKAIDEFPNTELLRNYSDVLWSNGYMDWALELTIKAKNRLEKELDPSDEKVLSINYDLEQHLIWLGKYTKAIDHSQKLTDLVRKHNGEHSVEYGRAISNLSGSYWAVGNYESAIEQCRKARQVYATVLGEDSLVYALETIKLANITRSSGSSEDALAYYKEALDLIRTIKSNSKGADLILAMAEEAKIYGKINEYKQAELLWEAVLFNCEENTSISSDMINRYKWLYADILLSNGNTEKALTIFQEALSDQTSLEFKELMELLPEINRSALSVLNRGYTAEAERMFQKALGLFETMPSYNKADLAETLDGLGRVHASYELWDDAADYFRSAIENYNESVGERQLDLAEAYLHLGRVLVEKSDYSNAEKALRSSIEIYNRSMVADSQKVPALGLLAEALLNQGMDQAVSTAEMAFKFAGNLESIESGNFISAFNDLISCIEAFRNEDELVKLYDNTLNNVIKIVGNEHPLYVEILYKYTTYLANTKNYKRAEKFCRELVEVAEKTIGSDNPNLGVAYFDLSQILKELDDRVGAEEYLVKAIEVYRTNLGDEHPQTMSAMQALFLLLVRQGRKAEAAEIMSILTGQPVEEAINELSNVTFNFKDD